MIAHPVNGKEPLYIASHAYAGKGMDVQEGAALIDAATTAVTSPEPIYSHA
ncbi:MAG: hypothetical protein GDA41_07320 [Rhodospirillales bacterium]|nr:hypothetical protein [Rhodospirillales bacterium]